MGFWSGLTGSDGKTSQTSQSTATSAKDLSQATKGTVGNAGTSITSTLDPGTIATLRDTIGRLAPQAGRSQDADTIRSLIPLLQANADPAVIDASIKSQQAEATRKFALGEGAQIAQTQQQIGSKGNSASILLEQQGNNDLQTSLSSLASTIQAQGRAQHGQDLSAAVGASGAAANAEAGPLTQLLSAIQVLSGAQTTQHSDQTQAQDLLTKIFGTETQNTTGYDVGNSSQSKGLLPSILSIFG